MGGGNLLIFKSKIKVAKQDSRRPGVSLNCQYCTVSERDC